jgi:hypothetical protein
MIKMADTLLEINVNTGIVTQLGVVPFLAHGEMTVYNGRIYYLHVWPVWWNIHTGVL